MNRARLICLVAGLMFLMLCLSAAIFGLWLNDRDVVLENHLVEWTQVVLLVLAATVHIWRCMNVSWAGNGAWRMGLALLCVSMAVREVDIDRLASSPLMPTVEAVVRGIVIAAWTIYGWFAIRLLGQWWHNRHAALASGMVMLTLAGCVLYGLSWPLDKYPDVLGDDVSRLIEETLQLNATAMFLLGSLAGNVIMAREG